MHIYRSYAYTMWLIYSLSLKTIMMLTRGQAFSNWGSMMLEHPSIQLNLHYCLARAREVGTNRPSDSSWAACLSLMVFTYESTCHKGVHTWIIMSLMGTYSEEVMMVSKSLINGVHTWTSISLMFALFLKSLCYFLGVIFNVFSFPRILKLKLILGGMFQDIYK